MSLIPSRWRRALLATATLLWLGAVGVGMKVLFGYSAAAGTAARPPVTWPATSAIVREPGKPTLVMLAHPRCPCTRASIQELHRLMTRLEGRLHAHVLFVKPPNVADDFTETDLWRSAVRVPGTTVTIDSGGAEAARFQAETSGQTVLYDGAGRLLFQGGITGSRGHQGDNVGRSRIVSLITRGEADRRESSVFGCELANRARVERGP